MSQSADAFFIGRILGSSGFKDGTFCRWWIVCGQQWRLVAGIDRGQTQTDSPGDDSEVNVWSHPIDAHFEFSGMQGWPKLSFQVWEHDSLGRSYLGGYGFCALPMSPGNYKLDIEVWCPIGNTVEELTSEFIGGSPHLRNQDIVHKPTDRSRLKSKSIGTIHVDMNLILGRISGFPVAF